MACRLVSLLDIVWSQPEWLKFHEGLGRSTIHGVAMFLCCYGKDTEEASFVTSFPVSFLIDNFEEVVQVDAQPVSLTVRQPEPPCATFTVVIPTKGFSTLGVQIDLIEKHPPMVTKIEEGAIQNFNKVHSNSMIQPFDVLMAVDGVQSWESIEKKINDLDHVPDQLFVTLNRPRRVQVVLEKAGSMGLTLAFTEVSAIRRQSVGTTSWEEDFYFLYFFHIPHSLEVQPSWWSYVGQPDAREFCLRR